MRVQRNVAGIAIIASLALAGVGCGGGGSSVADKIAEKAAEKSTGNKVDIDSKDGSVKVTDKEGNQVEYGNGAKLPADWPDELKPPSSVTIVASSTNTTNGKKSLFVTAESKASVADLQAGLKSQFEDAGYEITNESNFDSTDGGYANLEAKSDAYTASVSFAEDSSTKKTTILFTVTPADAS